MKFNDRIFFVWVLVMLLAISATSLFFKNDWGFYKNIATTYVILVLLVSPFVRRIDISNNYKKWVMYGGVTAFIFWFSYGTPAHDIYSNWFFALLWCVFVIGVSETLIQIGVRQKFPLWLSVLIMSGIHFTAVMLATGDYSFSSVVLFQLAKIGAGFFLFYWLLDKFKDYFLVAIIHGLYDFFLLGGI